MLKTIRQWLRSSSRVHIRESPVRDLPSCIALIDRFLDGNVRYPLEWDDFVSWKHEAPGIEAIRARIGSLEPQFFSIDATVRLKAVQALVAERNRIAGLTGIALRGVPAVEEANAT